MTLKSSQMTLLNFVAWIGGIFAIFTLFFPKALSCHLAELAPSNSTGGNRFRLVVHDCRGADAILNWV